MIGKFAETTIKVDVILSIVLVGIERLLENEFACPCRSNNTYFYNVLLSCTTLIIIWLTVFIQINQYKNATKDEARCLNCSAHEDYYVHENNYGLLGKDAWKVLKTSCGSCDTKACCAFFRLFLCVLCIGLSLLIPALTWIILWYFQGDYYVCGMSNWNGVWEDTQSNVPRKWCEPSGTNETLIDLEKMSGEWFLQSQIFSVNLFIGLTACIIAYTLFLSLVILKGKNAQSANQPDMNKNPSSKDQSPNSCPEPNELTPLVQKGQSPV